MTAVIRIKPYHYIHVLDNNNNVTRVEVGPRTFTRQEHEQVVFGPEPMITIPPRNYSIISNPVLRDDLDKPVFDKNGIPKLKYGDQEIRFEQPPFALFPGETLSGKVTPLQVVEANQALKLRGIRDFVQHLGKDKDPVARAAGDEWLFEGPATYLPMVEVQVVELVKATILKQNQALRLRAKKTFADRKGTKREAGEEWLIRDSGAYLPQVDEEVVGVVNAIILNEKKALHLRATRTFKDVFGVLRRNGEEWLIGIKETEAHIPDVYEQVVAEVNIITLTNRQYCVVLDPVGADGKPQFGKRLLKKGDCSFFLRPGESLEQGIQRVHVLSEEEALLLRAREAHLDESVKGTRKPGEKWMIYGPCDYVPPVEVEVVEKRKVLPLDENEGIYVRDVKTGKVRAVIGHSYMLKPNEELWSKNLPKFVEDLLTKERLVGKDRGADAIANAEPRDKTKVVTYRAPHNSAVQIYDYKTKKARVVFGPELIMLGPDEHFTVISLSGEVPKKADVIKSLSLLLGPDFMTDLVIVETSDHARLSLKLSYNWHFEIDRTKADDASRIFSVGDFTGDACKAIASMVRGAVAGVSFDEFHRNSAKIIRKAVFGVDDKGKILNRLVFSANNLVITNIDIQSVEPVDQRTRDSLQKSVQLAIEITTKSQEASAKHEAERLEQEAKGRLERQKILDQCEAEKARKDLINLQAQSAAVESTGQATAEAKARAEAAGIEGEAAVNQAKLKADATTIQSESELGQLVATQDADLAHQQALTELEIKKAREMAHIEAAKFRDIVKAIGADTIQSIAQAGPEMQAKLLQGLGLQSFLITDGNSPINLFNTAQGLLAGPTKQ